MLQRFGPHAANALTALRVVSTPFFVVLVCVAARAPAAGVLAVVLFGIAAASDIADGRLARRWCNASSAGRVFDHLADITFILSALSTYMLLGIAPWWVPAAVAGSFVFYVIDSWSRTAPGASSLLGSRIGHAAGVLNYALVGILVCNNSAGIDALSNGTLRVLFACVPAYSALAVVTRLAGRGAATPVAEMVPDTK